jgi:plasminogen activator inhibitor 1 RNA-binding protein
LVPLVTYVFHLLIVCLYYSGNEVPKGGAGKGNWGSTEDEIAAQRRELEEGGEVVADKEKVEVVEEPVEPEAPTFTLDEFLAKRDAERSNSSIFKKVEERAVTDDFSKLKKGGDELDNFVVLGAGKSKTVAAKSQRSSKSLC